MPEGKDQEKGEYIFHIYIHISLKLCIHSSLVIQLFWYGAIGLGLEYICMVLFGICSSVHTHAFIWHSKINFGPQPGKEVSVKICILFFRYLVGLNLGIKLSMLVV